MKKFFKYALMAAAVAAAPLFTACDDDENTDNNADEAQTAALKVVNANFVDKTVIPTYNALADRCIELQEAVEALAADKTQANLEAACADWKKARQFWEWSEAFLFGAASKYGIDPHIDTWPLDEATLFNLLSNNISMGDLNDPNGILGFHCLEYILFREGAPRPLADLADDQLNYAIYVAEDLTVSACRLEAAWAGLENVSQAKQQILEEAEAEPEDDFGEQMKLAGQAGSLYKTVVDGTVEIIEGARDIIDEVAHQKIGRPHLGTSDDDIAYIESPHAYNSIQDFEDNIVSVRNSYYGALGATEPQDGSLSAYLATANPDGNAKVIEKLNAAIAAIHNMEKPFVLNRTDSKADVAIAALEELDEALEEVQKAL